jgi:hypothetical protein
MIEEIKRIFGPLAEEIKYSPIQEMFLIINNSSLMEPIAIGIDVVAYQENTTERLKYALETLQNCIKYELERRLARQIQTPRLLDT